LGFVQGLDSVLDAADRLREHEKIRFVFVGDGGGKETMLVKSKKLKLPNVQFISYQPRECMPEVLAAADASLVALARGSGFEALPSKTYSILASGRPVIVSVDPGSDAWDLVDRSEAGLCIPPESPEELVGAILRLYHDSLLRESLGRHGREYVLRNHSPEHAAEAFERLLSRARQASSVTPT
jgi:colanic acid biosynthesis glycosyl transferase WcaI